MIARRCRGEPCAFPAWISPGARDILAGLLAADPAERLGSRGGALDIKEHAWPAEVDWTRVYRREPQPAFPVFPPVRPSSDAAANFDKGFTDQPAPQDLRGFAYPVASRTVLER